MIADCVCVDRQAAKILRENSAYLSALQNRRLAPMKAAAQRLRSAASNLEERVRFNQSSLSDAIEMLIGQTEKAQTFLQNNGPGELTKANLHNNLKGGEEGERRGRGGVRELIDCRHLTSTDPLSIINLCTGIKLSNCNWCGFGTFQGSE